jgi:hypothetical protein
MSMIIKEIKNDLPKTRVIKERMPVFIPNININIMSFSSDAPESNLLKISDCHDIHAMDFHFYQQLCYV